jgi:hypothetical protein
MAHRDGSDLLLLDSDRSITRARLWGARVVVFLVWVTPTATRPVSLASGLGTVAGMVVIYWAALRVLSGVRETDDDADPTTKLSAVLAENDVATRRELIDAAMAAADHEDRDECWDELVQPFLKAQTSVQQMDSSGRRWTQQTD